MEIRRLISIEQLAPNTGQISGLPQNPRFCRDARFEKLKKSLQDDPEMLDLRELLVIPFSKQFVIIGGNMRFRAAKELGIEKLPCKVIDPATPAEKLRAYAIKDNVGYGEDDVELLANEWDVTELEDWGVFIPGVDAVDEYKEQEIEEPMATQCKCPKCGYEFDK